MINRRELLESTLGVGAALALTPEVARALTQSGGKAKQPAGGQLIHRAIPSTGEMLPVIGLGFANHPSCADPAALKEVLKTFSDNGGRVFDTMQTSEDSTEEFHATVADELGIQSKLFLGLKGFSGRGGSMSDPAAAKAQIESLLARFKVSKLDLVQLPVAAEPVLGRHEGRKKRGTDPAHRLDDHIIRAVPASRVDHAKGVDRLRRSELHHRRSPR